ncbi:MAG: Na+/H+ antiporter NhaC family protein [Lachnospiraceae bacterium]|nr:Na+/H+ antiporter NhaC family protein [Lachnospiraceae bacterium]
MKKKKSTIVSAIAIAAVAIFMIVAGFVTTADSVQETGWALVPPVIAIALALITKEVYSSLFVGILAGALLYTGYSFEGTMNRIFSDGIVASLTDAGHMGIIVFLVILGAMVQLMNRTGGSAAFGNWAKKHIRTRAGAELATIVLGCLIFIDDYFNCLTVGSVMRPVTDSHKVSRAKLAYLIDATAAPVCIIAPISSWAAAVSGYVQGENGIKLFIETIPYNYYALLTIVMMLFLVILNVDYGPMYVHEKNALLNGDLYTTPERPYENAAETRNRTDGHVIDLLFPIITLVIGCVIGMIYTGGFFSGTNFVDAFAGSDASVGLMLGSFGALVVTILFYLVRRILKFTEIMECIPDGFKAMVPAILILTFAWTLNGMTSDLGAKEFVAGLVQNSATGFTSILPLIVFLVAVGLSFATGTSWGTFGILIPIVIACFPDNHQMMVLSMSACMAGSVCGDHCSPISDTTIMSSAGAQCLHINHVNTQIPYAMTCAAISAVTYVVAGFTHSAVISLLCGIAMMIGILAVIKKNNMDKKAELDAAIASHNASRASR